jgi:hypothetical protein
MSPYKFNMPPGSFFHSAENVSFDTPHIGHEGPRPRKRIQGYQSLYQNVHGDAKDDEIRIFDA